jgi:NAD+ synthase (glutamine-hydrolysing)
MSFKKNRDNIIKSIKMAKEMGASYRLGPELEVCGYSCEDHFFEPDTEKHSWEMLADILKDKDLTKDILCDIGMPVAYKGTLYNCRVYVLNQEILLIRPKLFMADGDNYRENRYFKPWNVDDRELYDFPLPDFV